MYRTASGVRGGTSVDREGEGERERRKANESKERAKEIQQKDREKTSERENESGKAVRLPRVCHGIAMLTK